MRRIALTSAEPIKSGADAGLVVLLNAGHRSSERSAGAGKTGRATSEPTCRDLR